MKIKILGVENAQHKKLEKIVRKTVKRLSLAAEIQIIAGIDDILKHDIIGIPALLINDKVVVQCDVPDENKLSHIFRSHVSSRQQILA